MARPRKVQPDMATHPQTGQDMKDYAPQGFDAEHEDAISVADAMIKVSSDMGRVDAAKQLVRTREANTEAKSATEEGLDALNKFMSNPEVVAMPPDVYRARQMAQIKAEAMVNCLDTTIPGGRYLVNNVWVNSEGEPIE